MVLIDCVKFFDIEMRAVSCSAYQVNDVIFPQNDLEMLSEMSLNNQKYTIPI